MIIRPMAHRSFLCSFAASVTLDLVYDWVVSATGGVHGVLVSAYPKREFPRSSVTIANAGFDGKKVALTWLEK